MAKESKTCFVIAPIGAEGSPERKRSDQMLRHLIQPAAKSTGYDAVRSDKISEPGIITSQVIEHVVNDQLVVADLTGRNPNVFYELAIRHATGKPCVQLIHRSDNLPFDVAPQRTIFVDLSDPDDLETARSSLVEQIKAAETGERSDNPITVALDLQSLRNSGDPLEEQLASLHDELAEIKRIISRLTPPPTKQNRLPAEIGNLSALFSAGDTFSNWLRRYFQPLTPGFSGAMSSASQQMERTSNEQGSGDSPNEPEVSE